MEEDVSQQTQLHSSLWAPLATSWGCLSTRRGSHAAISRTLSPQPPPQVAAKGQRGGGARLGGQVTLRPAPCHMTEVPISVLGSLGSDPQTVTGLITEVTHLCFGDHRV